MGTECPTALTAPDATPQRRALPYPYRAMMAICSDVDETPDRRVYADIMRFLNTGRDTAMGPGVGLEVGNSIYFDMPPGQFAYWNTDEAGREMIRTLIRSGHVDCLHSYGDLAATRAHAGRALDELARHDLRPEVWIDHSTAPTNLGPDIMQGHGDQPGHEAYHADLTAGFGVRYVWIGRVTSVIGQEVPPSVGGLFRPDHPIRSGRTVAKELAKRVLARRGNAKYAIHADNRLLSPRTLRDGTAVYEFLRSNPYWGGVSLAATASGLGEVLTEQMLDRLVGREGACLLYTHLGKVRDPRRPFDAEAAAALRRLGQAYRDGRILVTTTRRLLGYFRAAREVVCSTRSDGGRTWFDLTTPAVGPLADVPLGRSDLSGMTFYVPKASSAGLTVNGREAADVVRNGPDHTGRESISLPWPRLTFPDL